LTLRPFLDNITNHALLITSVNGGPAAGNASSGRKIGMSLQEQRDEVVRILHSPQFRRAPKLQRFVELICEYHFQGRLSELDEFAIATRAFGKSPNFDPGVDSLVRVQAREVRRRLREYYQDEGRSSRWVLDIPAGHYAPVFTPAAAPPETAPPPKRAVPLRAAWVMLAGTFVVCAALLIAADHERRLMTRTTAMAASRELTPVGPKTAALWNRFLESDVPTLLVVSNPDVGECGGRKPGTAGCEDEYTGMGEAVAIHLITSLFGSTKQTLIVKPSRIVSADDVKRYNLVLLGGKGVNVWTRRLGEGLSLSEHDIPQFETVVDQASGQITRDKGIIALRRHPSTGRWVLFLWGHHSQGTHAAAEASTDERFLSQIHWPANSFPESFHILVGVNINDGIPERPLAAALRVP
jgi:hypothetical protein